MCLMALALDQSSRWPLVLASNRDEFHDRPALPLSRWTTTGGIEVISGRDLQAGGTWLGCTRGGRVALLTNVREGAVAAGPRSRGELPLRWLTGSQNSQDFLASTPASDYAGCNLLMGDSVTGEWTWASNRGDRIAVPIGAIELNNWRYKVLDSGVYGLSNAVLDTPWPKTKALKTALAQGLASADNADRLQAQLWTALSSRERAAFRDLPDTGIEQALEHGLSSAWVDLPERGYGTRCSTLLWLEAAQGQALRLYITEKSWTPGSLQPEEMAMSWALP